MPIAALPKATKQLLGSSQVLTTPTSLVKELIDNALDAQATSIDVCISKNTLDKLEVRDNGHGILFEDLDSLGKPGHTSKLRTFEELKSVGRISLGFRGEALASAVQLGEVSVATKTGGSTVAMRVVLKTTGGADQKVPTSHPVGTTVSISKFMYNIPVRKKVFEKEAPKTLAKINQLLRSYALARPFIRFSLKIKEGCKGSWSFAPRPHDGIKEAVSLVIGRDVVMECIEASMTAVEHPPKEAAVFSGVQDLDSSFDASHVEDGLFVIKAFLPKPDANPSKIGTGQYLSVDSRPVSHEKGTMKKIVTLFKKYIRGAGTDSSENFKNPFIRLNIECPVASYDANVEPAKDEVLFGNEQFVLELAENLLKQVYGELKPIPDAFYSKSSIQALENFDLLLAREPEKANNFQKGLLHDAVSMPEISPAAPTMASLPQNLPSSQLTVQTSSLSDPALESPASEIEDASNKQLGNDHRKWGFSISTDYSEDVGNGRQRNQLRSSVSPNSQQTPDCEVSANPLNPWIIAKMTAPINFNQSTSNPRVLANRPLSGIVFACQSESDHLSDSSRLVPPIRGPRQTFCNENSRDLQTSVHRRYSTSSVRQLHGEQVIGDEIPPVQGARRNDLLSARDLSEQALVSPPPTVVKTVRRNREPNRPFVSPHTIMTTGNQRADQFVQTTLFGNGRGQPSSGEIVIQTEPDKDLAWAMDFEYRKEAATRRCREQIRVKETEAVSLDSSPPPRLSPYKNRYNAAIASLESNRPQINASNVAGPSKFPYMTTLLDGDARAYLITRQRSFAAQKDGSGEQLDMMRAESTRLPLETIPQGERLSGLVYNMSTDMDKLQSMVEVLVEGDMYVRRGSQIAGLRINEEEMPLLATRLQEIVNQWIGIDRKRKYEVQ